MSTDRAADEPRQRRLPVVTVVLMGAAIAFIVMLFLGDPASPYLLGGPLWLGAVYIFVPALLFVGAATAAPFHRSVDEITRILWGLAAAICAVTVIPAMWFVGVLLFGP